MGLGCSIRGVSPVSLRRTEWPTYLPTWTGFVGRYAMEPVLEGGEGQAVRLRIVVDTERH